MMPPPPWCPSRPCRLKCSDAQLSFATLSFAAPPFQEPSLRQPSPSPPAPTHPKQPLTFCKSPLTTRRTSFSCHFSTLSVNSVIEQIPGQLSPRSSHRSPSSPTGSSPITWPRAPTPRPHRFIRIPLPDPPPSSPLQPTFSPKSPPCASLTSTSTFPKNSSPNIPPQSVTTHDSSSSNATRRRGTKPDSTALARGSAPATSSSSMIPR